MGSWCMELDVLGRKVDYTARATARELSRLRARVTTKVILFSGNLDPAPSESTVKGVEGEALGGVRLASAARNTGDSNFAQRAEGG